MTQLSGPVLLAVFGAGASHGCLPAPPDPGLQLGHPPGSHAPGTLFALARPPLTQDLVRPDAYAAAILAKYEAAIPVVDAVRRRIEIAADGSPTVSFERALAEYEERADHDPQAKRHLAAMRFYLRDLLAACSDLMRSPAVGGGITNQVAVVRDLHTWAMKFRGHACLTSFNYDIILESACKAVYGFRADTFDHYTSNEAVSVLKPHGSVFWEWPLRGLAVNGDLAAVAQASIERSVDTDPDLDGLRAAPWPYTGESNASVSREPALPALALPVDSKSELVWPADQAAHFSRLQGNISKLLVVGWRAVEDHFLSTMDTLAARAKVVIVTGGPNAIGEAQEIRDRLWARVTDNTSDVRTATEGFEGFARTSLLDWLLED